MASPTPIEDLLDSWAEGDDRALEELVPLVESRLHRIASWYMRHERPGHVLEEDALVNETFFKLRDLKQVRWQSEDHFFAVAGQIMHRILLNYARDRKRLKRGGGALEESPLDLAYRPAPELGKFLPLEEALERLARIDERMYRVVELRFFVGLSVEEIAKEMNVSPTTVKRDWSMAKAWLARALSDAPPTRWPSQTVTDSHESFTGLYCELKGDGAGGDEVRYGSAVSLLFNYGMSAKNVLTKFREDRPTSKDADLGIAVSAKGFTFRDQVWYRTAHFRDGALLEPVEFFLQASETPVNEPGFYITFDVRGYVLCQSHLTVRLKKRLSGQARHEGYNRKLDLYLDDIIREQEEAARAMGMGG